MKTALPILKFVILSLIGLVLLSLFWMFLIPGMLLWWIFRGRYRGWIEPVTALSIVLILRFSAGVWQMRIGGHSSGDWHAELVLGLVSWMIGSILVTAGYCIPPYFLDGLKAKSEPQAEPHTDTKKEVRHVARGCLFIVVVTILLGVVGYLNIRAPDFSGTSATSIDITMRTRRSPTAESKVLIQASIANGPPCASLFALLRSARIRMDHKCADIGSFTVRYANGKTDTLAVLPGHDPTGYEFRFGGRLYRLPRERLYQVLRDAGVDTTKMPDSEH